MGGDQYKTVAEKKRRSKKRSFPGNRWTKKNGEAATEESSNCGADTGVSSDGNTVVDEFSTNGNDNNDTAEGVTNLSAIEKETISTILSSSANKIDMSYYTEHGEESSAATNNVTVENTSYIYMLLDVNILLKMLQLVGHCPECQHKIIPSIDFSLKKGLAQMIVIKCENDSCTWDYTTYSSNKMETSQRYDVNVRSVMAFREIGHGLTHVETFSRVMNMPPPYSHSSYDKIVKEITPHYIAAMNDSMLAAAKNVNPSEQVGVVIENSVSDCDVSLDGSWQRRGYASLNGFVSCIERCHDKVVDIDIMTKDCKSCKLWQGKENDPGYADWIQSHDCPINHTGSSGSMETEGAVRIFSQSIAKNNLRYINYIGDGDSSAYKTVTEKKPYGDFKIGKLECVGHIQKRVGAGLMTLVKNNKGIGGQGNGKLTRKVISTLQNYYGIAIRENKNKSLLQMKMAIAAILHHCTLKENEDKMERHKYCPKEDGTWCKYHKSRLNGEDFKGDRINIQEGIYNLIRPLWIKLSDSTLLEKCLHGRTQNVNEAFNAFVWKRSPKDIFVGKKVLDMSIASAVVSFNDGAAGILSIMGKVGLHVGHFNLSLSHKADLVRIEGMEYKGGMQQKKRRKKLHAQKKGFAIVQDQYYGAGMH